MDIMITGTRLERKLRFKLRFDFVPNIKQQFFDLKSSFKPIKSPEPSQAHLSLVEGIYGHPLFDVDLHGEHLTPMTINCTNPSLRVYRYLTTLLE